MEIHPRTAENAPCFIFFVARRMKQGCTQRAQTIFVHCTIKEPCIPAGNNSFKIALLGIAESTNEQWSKNMNVLT